MLVVKSNRQISRILLSKFKKVSKGIVFYRYNCIEVMLANELSEDELNVLKSYKKQKFEIVSFTDKQFVLTANRWGYKKGYANEVINLPLKHRFAWFTDNKEGIQSVTPITTKQLNNIIKIN